jgi:hypothetical protein
VDSPLTVLWHAAACAELYLLGATVLWHALRPRVDAAGNSAYNPDQ